MENKNKKNLSHAVASVPGVFQSYASAVYIRFGSTSHVNHSRALFPPPSYSIGIEIERRQHTEDQRRPITREYKQRKLNHHHHHHHNTTESSTAAADALTSLYPSAPFSLFPI
jgi:hypothetical protein